MDIKKLVPWESESIMEGQKYGRLMVISTHKISGTYRYFAKCRCVCGSEPIFVRVDALRKTEGGSRQPTKSCGCLQKEQVTKHGAWGHPLFTIWSSMMDRCYKPKCDHFHLYGNRGITVCDRWHDVNNFIQDVSDEYRKGLQIDRIDNNGNYSKDNCRWATRSQQMRNKRTNINLTLNGETHCLIEWSHITGINYGTLVERVSVLKWPVEKALTQPVRKGNYVRKAT